MDTAFAGNETYGVAVVNLSPRLRAEAYVRLEELLGEIDAPGANRDSIESKLEWFRENLPIVAAVLSITESVRGLGIAT